MDISSLPKADTSWFTQSRFGMFIHWGLYAMAARHEWLMNNEKIPVEEYERKYFKHFDPDLYDPEAWAAAAENAGMKYLVVTSKHHEGFCLWDSKFTDYKATNTPAKRDLLRPMLDAFRARGLRAGLYHSLIDWHHPDFVIDHRIGPYRERSDAERTEMNAKRDQKRYIQYLHNQVRELLTEYGKIDVMWFDFSYPDDACPEDFTKGKGRFAWDSEKLLAMIRELAPNIMLNDRLNLPGVCDVWTPEQFQPREWFTHEGRRVVWEACQTFSGSWGYHRDESSWRDADELVRTLVDSVSKGGNLLLNVGPTGRGEFDERALSRLRDIGEWMKRHNRAIYGCTEAPAGITAPPDCRLTYNPETNRLYLHLFAWPYEMVHLDDMADKVEYAQFLHDGSEVQFGLSWQHYDLGHNTLSIRMPWKKPAVAVPVIELFLK